VKLVINAGRAVRKQISPECCADRFNPSCSSSLGKHRLGRGSVDSDAGGEEQLPIVRVAPLSVSPVPEEKIERETLRLQGGSDKVSGSPQNLTGLWDDGEIISRKSLADYDNLDHAYAYPLDVENGRGTQAHQASRRGPPGEYPPARRVAGPGHIPHRQRHPMRIEAGHRIRSFE